MVILFGILFAALFLAYLQLKYSMGRGPTTTALLAKARQNHQALLERNALRSERPSVA
jgi:hypothetical protein